MRTGPGEREGNGGAVAECCATGALAWRCRTALTACGRAGKDRYRSKGVKVGPHGYRADALIDQAE